MDVTVRGIQGVKTTRLLALASLLSVACAAPASELPRAQPIVAQRLVASATPRDMRSEATPTTFALEPVAQTAVAAALKGESPLASCVDATKARGFYGLYRTDAWEKANVVLTFDDGPHPSATPRVLDMLRQRQLAATFFLVGRNISRDTYPLVQRMIADGHTLGSHSYSHDVHMTRVAAPDATVADIVAQHSATAALIDLAVMARSGDDFDAMFRQVFESDPAVWLTATALRRDRAGFEARHAELLRARGYAEGDRAYHVLYSRPPGGGPYVEQDGAAGVALYDRALSKLGMVNVLWHGASGDTVPEKRSDFAFLTRNMETYAASGGVLLIHDYMRPDALAHGLDAMSASGVNVTGIDAGLSGKYKCPTSALAAMLSGHAPEIVAGR